MKLNRCDLGIGAAYSLALWPLIGPLTVLSMIATSILWSLGGIGWRAYRYIGCPLAVAWFVWWGHHDLRVLWCLPTASLWLTIGYSMPDINEAKASLIGMFWTKHIPNPIEANVATRSTYGLLAAASWGAAPILGLCTWDQYLSSACIMAILFGASVYYLVGEVEL